MQITTKLIIALWLMIIPSNLIADNLPYLAEVPDGRPIWQPIVSYSVNKEDVQCTIIPLKIIFSRWIHFPTQDILSDAESNICKYNPLIDSDITLFWRDRSYAEGRLRDRKLARICKYGCRQKKENAKNCKNDFPVFCRFTFVNADFCRFLQSLRSEWSATCNFSPFRYIYLCSSLYIFVIWR